MDTSSPRTTILLVEDSEDDAFFFRKALSKSGLECDLVHVLDGGAAVRFLEAALAGGPRPEHIFLDLKLPGLNGFDVLTWIGAQNFDPPLEISILSGSDHTTDRERAKALGAAAYLVKPVTVACLQERMSNRPNAHASN
jgi:CheY-like chemotaxis protein